MSRDDTSDRLGAFREALIHSYVRYLVLYKTLRREAEPQVQAVRKYR